VLCEVLQMLEQRRGSNKKTMKHESNIRKHRGRGGGGGGGGGGGRRNGGGSRQRFADGNGQKVKVRGNASQILEKYLSLARDATTASDRVAAENYYQHAEHYYRSMHSSDERQGVPKAVNSDKPTVAETVVAETEAAKPATAKARIAKPAVAETTVAETTVAKPVTAKVRVAKAKPIASKSKPTAKAKSAPEASSAVGES